jgi:hypothetical protein
MLREALHSYAVQKQVNLGCQTSKWWLPLWLWTVEGAKGVRVGLETFSMVKTLIWES